MKSNSARLRSRSDRGSVSLQRYTTLRMSDSNVAASDSSGSPVSGAIAGRDSRRTQAHTSTAASTAADVRLLTNIGHLRRSPIGGFQQRRRFVG